MEKRCRWCGNGFTAKNNAEQFCSNYCRRQSIRAKNRLIAKKTHTINCAWCGKTFTTERKRKYCCRLCQLRANGRIKGIAPKPENKPVKTLEEVAKICKELNITYGQYTKLYERD